MTCEIRSIEPAQIDELEQHPSRLGAMLGWEDENDDDEIEGVAVLDIGKMWHGLHYLLTGSANEGAPPLDFLLHGGKEVGEVEEGDVPPRAFSPEQVRIIRNALANVSETTLRARYNPTRMVTEDIYPQVIWTRVEENNLEALLETAASVQQFLDAMVRDEMGILVYVG